MADVLVNDNSWTMPVDPVNDATGVALSADGRLALSGDKTVRVWDLIKGQALHTLEQHSERVNLVALSADGRLAMSGDGIDIRVWDVIAGRCLQTVTGVAGYVRSLALSADGTIAATLQFPAIDPTTLRVWPLPTGG